MKITIGRLTDGDNIIPNYFELFIRKNIKLHYESDSDCFVFKADSDQDRLNIIKNKKEWYFISWEMSFEVL